MGKITVNGIDYYEKDNDSEIQIVILQRGWIMVGRFEREGLV